VRVHGALEADSFTAGATVDTGATVAITSTATPIDTLIRLATAKAPPRPKYLPYPIVVSLPAAPPVDAWHIAHSERSAFAEAFHMRCSEIFVIRTMFSKVFSTANTDTPQIFVAVSKWAGTGSSRAANQGTKSSKYRGI
jgi:hypothetical protein